MGKSQTTAKNKYNAKSYDRISVTVKKGVKDEWKSEAEKQGLSLNAFIEQAVNQIMTVADYNDTMRESHSAFDKNVEVSNDAEQNIQDLSETDILNNAFMKISESCQKLLSAHLDLIELFPNKKLCSPYRETISNYFWAIMNENIEQLLYRINEDEVKTDVHSILNAVNREVNIFKGHIDSNDLEEYLKQFNELMNLDEDE
mgnify:CR=1 FL=1